MKSNEYKNLILTNHAIARMQERGITQYQIYETYKNPDSSSKVDRGGLENFKRFEGYSVTLIYKVNEINQPVILSCWMDPPRPGTREAKIKENWVKYKKAGFWGKIWYTLLRQIGI